MTRNIKVAAAQLGPIQKADLRQAVVARMLALMQQAKGCDLIVYPELALTTFFPRWHYGERSEADIWFEREMPGTATRPLFEEAQRAAIAMSFGYAELTPDGHHFNTSILVDKAGAVEGEKVWLGLQLGLQLELSGLDATFYLVDPSGEDLDKHSNKIRTISSLTGTIGPV